MFDFGATDVKTAWERAWSWFDDVLAQAGRSDGGNCDVWGLAVFLDVPAFSIAELIPSARDAGLTRGFDLEEKVREGVREALARLRDLGHEDASGPLPLEFGLTEAILLWEWCEMEAAEEHPSAFFERVRELRLRMPEVAVCERTTHRILCRVPPPRIEEALV